MFLWKKDDIPPEQYDTLYKIITNSNSRVVVVWDMESLGWRSFYPESIIDIFQSEQKKSDRE